MTPPSPGARLSTSAEELLSGRTRDWSSLVALFGVAGVIVVTGSGPTVLLGLGLLVVAMVTPATVAFVLGQLALLPALEITEPIVLIGTQLALLVVLTEPARSPGRRHALGGTGIAALGLGGLVVVTVPYGLGVTGSLLGLSVGGALYVIHRVTVVRVEMATEQATTPDAGPETAPTQSAPQPSSDTGPAPAATTGTTPAESPESKE